MVSKAPYQFGRCDLCGRTLYLKHVVHWDGKPMHPECAFALKEAYERMMLENKEKAAVSQK